MPPDLKTSVYSPSNCPSFSTLLQSTKIGLPKWILYCNHKTSWNHGKYFFASVFFCIFPFSKGHLIRAYLESRYYLHDLIFIKFAYKLGLIKSFTWKRVATVIPNLFRTFLLDLWDAMLDPGHRSSPLSLKSNMNLFHVKINVGN